jgi:PAS domain S-box-containing protein
MLDVWAVPLFGVLIVFTTTFGVTLAGGAVSLLPMTSAATLLVLGLVPAGWLAVVGAVAHGAIRYYWGEQLAGRRIPGGIRLVALTSANMAMHTSSILVAGAVYRWTGGDTPAISLSLASAPQLLLAFAAYLAVNFAVAGAYMASRGREPLRLYWRSLPNLLLYEGAPMVFAPLVASIYLQLGLAQFLLFAIVLVVVSLGIRDLAQSRRRLERRVAELDSLQAVGQALSSSLHLDTILTAIYDQVGRLMPASNFYVALYNKDTDEVSFPIAVEEGEQVEWRSRRTGSGMTEYVLSSQAPLLIRSDVPAALEELGIEQFGHSASSWLGVPIIAGSEPLGVIAVQSYTTSGVYDESHQEVLGTIAAQAGVAIQNARLYELTDEALARRVQELNSILRTSSEGILLLDPNWRVLAANRALADSLGVAQLELDGQSLGVRWSDDGQPLAALLGYTLDTLRSDCESLTTTELASQDEIVTLGPSKRYFERSLTPVRNQENEISGWLLVLRDITEEIELARLRDDMMHMLVHDLRSPLSVLQGCLTFLESAFENQEAEDFDKLISMAENNTERMLGMVNQLLDIAKLESGHLPIDQQELDLQPLLEDVASRLEPLAREAHINVDVAIDQGLPQVFVDPLLITRVIHNLLDNAIKFTPDDGRIELWARRAHDLPDGYLMVGVTDTGPGIPPEQRSRLFRKFQQAVSTEGRRLGTGLGLPFCKLVVEAHGGRIWVETEVGKGSTFAMLLPTVGLVLEGYQDS